MDLLYLGSAQDLIAVFEAKDMTTNFMKSIKPTLSPKDPNFSAWWEQHRSEWENI